MLHKFAKGSPTTELVLWAVKSISLFLTWFLPLLGPLISIILSLIFGLCLLNFLVKFVSSTLQVFYQDDGPSGIPITPPEMEIPEL